MPSIENNLPFYDRLISKGNEYQNRRTLDGKREKEKQLSECTFQPAINDTSRNIARRQSSKIFVLSRDGTHTAAQKSLKTLEKLPGKENNSVQKNQFKKQKNQSIEQSEEQSMDQKPTLKTLPSLSPAHIRNQQSEEAGDDSQEDMLSKSKSTEFRLKTFVNNESNQILKKRLATTIFEALNQLGLLPPEENDWPAS